ncbi:hypothetical protein ABIF86_000242 [Bradyrhizobium japonicum]
MASDVQAGFIDKPQQYAASCSSGGELQFVNVEAAKYVTIKCAGGYPLLS